MKILISSTEYAIIIDTKETTLDEWLICLEQQYPIGIDGLEDGLEWVRPKRAKGGST